MAIEEDCVPGAQLMESMRAVGYSLPTALADIVDNSISALASSVAIHYSDVADDPYIAILDDGCGMSPIEARRAMQLAGNDSLSERSGNDLGRFGLGLKTASLSQCRKLTLITKRDGKTTGLVWDLDHLARSNGWSLIVLSDKELSKLPRFADLDAQESGTLVIWTVLDRFHAEGRLLSIEIDSQMIEARHHMSLIFHQFIGGQNNCKKTDISINGKILEALDPFLSGARGRQTTGKHKITIEGKTIDLQVFTLPFINKMSAKERDLAIAPGSLRDSQGFYIYRAGRLVIWGTWFRLMPKTETTKLTRVKVDIPNSLDHLWALDIKKSSAVPPAEVRKQLRDYASDMAEPSRKVFKYRGIKPSDAVQRIWELILERETFRYEINRTHPLINHLAEGLDKGSLQTLYDVLEMLEGTFPANDLFYRMSEDEVLTPKDPDDDRLRLSILALWRVTSSSKQSLSDFIENILSNEPWNVLDAIDLERWMQEQPAGVQNE